MIQKPEFTSGTSLSVWLAGLARRELPSLKADERADVCVVGGGIAGLTAAYALSERGRSVVLLEDGAIGSGETGRTTAHLSYALDDRYVELERMHGEEGARLAAESHRAAVDWIEGTAARHGIDCDFERLDGYLFAGREEDREALEREADAARRAGLGDVSFVERAPLARFDTGRCLRFPRQGQFHPLKYLLAMAEILAKRGVRIYERSHAEEVEEGTEVRVRVTGGVEVRADVLVVATNAPIVSRVRIPLKQYPYRSYVLGARVARGSVARALYWDTLDPYHYVRLQSMPSEESDVLIVGGEDHKTGQADDAPQRYERLDTWMRERFPEAQEALFRWSGQIMEPADGVAFIGRYPGQRNIYIATGDSGHGMTHGTIAGILLADLIEGRANAWSKLYDPGRVNLSAGTEAARENAKALARYADWMSKGDVASADQIEAGAGAVLRHGFRKIACYRDENGTLHRFSAACPHLGCVVRWNSAEKSWDCPCHGSRFSAEGKLLNGPANEDLRPL